MEISDVITQLTHPGSIFPRQAFVAAEKQRDLIMPDLLAALEKTLIPQDLNDQDD